MNLISSLLKLVKSVAGFSHRLKDVDGAVYRQNGRFLVVNTLQQGDISACSVMYLLLLSSTYLCCILQFARLILRKALSEFDSYVIRCFATQSVMPTCGKCSHAPARADLFDPIHMMLMPFKRSSHKHRISCCSTYLLSANWCCGVAGSWPGPHAISNSQLSV